MTQMTKKELGQELVKTMQEIESVARINLWKSVDGTKTTEDDKKLDALHARKNALISAMRNA